MTHTTKHTPGPWYPHYAKADHCLSSSVWGQEPGNQVAVIGGKSLEAMNANARLIAAAPVMYEALQAMLNGILFTRGASMSEDRWQTLTTIARTALSQAEGRQHE